MVLFFQWFSSLLLFLYTNISLLFFPSKFSFQKPNCVTQSPWYGMLCKLNGWMYKHTCIYRWKRIYWRIRKTVISRIPMDIVCAYLYMWVSDRLLKNYIFYGFGWCVVYLVKFFICSFSPRAHFNSFRFVHISNVYASSRPSSVFIYAHPEVQNQRPYGVSKRKKKQPCINWKKIFSKVWS